MKGQAPNHDKNTVGARDYSVWHDNIVKVVQNIASAAGFRPYSTISVDVKGKLVIYRSTDIFVSVLLVLDVCSLCLTRR